MASISPVLLASSNPRAQAPARVMIVEGGFFEDRGGRAELGRLIDNEDDQAGAEPVVVLSHDYWRRTFGGDREITGRPVKFNGVEYTVIGVAAEGFGGWRGRETDAWVPITSYARPI